MNGIDSEQLLEEVDPATNIRGTVNEIVQSASVERDPSQEKTRVEWRQVLDVPIAPPEVSVTCHDRRYMRIYLDFAVQSGLSLHRACRIA